MTPDCDESIRCTVSTCSCVCFKPGNHQLRSCDRCGHSWVMHALDKLRAHPLSGCCPAEVVLPGLVFDLSSLVLYGAQAIPVRLKILLDRLFSVLTTEQVGHILEMLGWSLGDYIRGYMLQYPNGKVLESWLMVNADEELLVLKQFLRFGETRPIVELMKVQRLTQNAAPTEDCSKITAFIERNCHVLDRVRSSSTRESLHVDTHPLRKRNPVKKSNNPVCHFEKIPGGLSLLLPFHFSTSTFSCLANKDFAPLSELIRCQRDAKQQKTEEPQGEGEAVYQSKEDKIKEDPDKQSHLSLREIAFNQGERTKQTSSSAFTSVSSPTVFPKSTSPFQVSLSTSMKTSQKLEASLSPSLNPLPSFSSFLCPLPNSSFSPSQRPLPPSLCSVSSLSGAAGRKGRVCCGVCGKSFYDKGTLKIHYNAVHLKIKHRCTVAGCTMVFSSLRSRNRHSANPNPRLHMGASRDVHTPKLANKQGETHRGAPREDTRSQIWRNAELDHTWQQERSEQETSCHSPCHRQPTGNWKDTPTSMSKLLPYTHSLFPIQRSSMLDSHPPTIPSPTDDPHNSLTNHTPLSIRNFPPAFVPSKGRPADIDASLLILKKKPRKSSMPVKIDRGVFEGRRIKQEKS